MNINQHLLTIQQLSPAEINGLLDQAQHYIDSNQHATGTLGSLKGKTLINLFFENSTRTRVSFEIAAKRLGAEVINIDINTSAISKGESLLDTIYTLQAMHTDFLVVRHSEDNIPQFIAENSRPGSRVINAGDGTHAHPSQALLDMLTIRQQKGDLSKLKVAMVGDISHSRVARSDIVALQKLGVGELRLIGPAAFVPADLPGVHYHNLDEGIAGVDVVMLLRVQKERMQQSNIPNLKTYFDQYGLTRNRLNLAKPDAIVMHPGPINRGVEIAGDVADCPQSVIYQQVSNGIAIRMAVLSA